MSRISRNHQNEKNGARCFNRALVCMFITLVMLTSFCCSFATAETKQTSEKTNYAYYGGDYYGIDQAAKSVFYVEIYNSDNKYIGSASGFVMFDEHLFITNQHVIDGASNLVIMDDNEEIYLINQVVVSDDEHDIAILLFPDGDKYHPLEYDAAFNELKRGQPVLAIGSPMGYVGTVSDGIISAFLPYYDEGLRIQITAPISHGSSGGCLLNEDLKVIGVTAGGREEGENIGWAIPIAVVEQLYSQWNKVDTIPLGTDLSWDTVGHGLHSRIAGVSEKPKTPDSVTGSSGNTTPAKNASTENEAPITTEPIISEDPASSPESATESPVIYINEKWGDEDNCHILTVNGYQLKKGQSIEDTILLCDTAGLKLEHLDNDPTKDVYSCKNQKILVNNSIEISDQGFHIQCDQKTSSVDLYEIVIATEYDPETTIQIMLDTYFELYNYAWNHPVYEEDIDHVTTYYTLKFVDWMLMDTDDPLVIFSWDNYKFLITRHKNDNNNQYEYDIVITI